MASQDCAPWYCIVFRIILFLFFGFLLACFYFFALFEVDFLCTRLFDFPKPLIFSFFLDHHWLFYLWGVCSLGLSFWNIVLAVVRAFCD